MAVNVSNIDVAWHDNTPLGLVELSRETSTDSFSFGDLCDFVALGLVDVTSTAENSDFLGVSLSTVDGGIDATGKVMVAMRAVIRAPLKTGEDPIYFGEAGAYNGGGNGTKWYFRSNATAAVSHCMSEVISATKFGLWAIDPYTLRGVTGFSFFELTSGA